MRPDIHFLFSLRLVVVLFSSAKCQTAINIGLCVSVRTYAIIELMLAFLVVLDVVHLILIDNYTVVWIVDLKLIHESQVKDCWVTLFQRLLVMLV